MKREEKLAALQAAMKGLRFGIEIETVGLSRQQLAATIATVVGGSASPYSEAIQPDGRKWSVVRDGSLSSELSGEVTSPILTWEDLPKLQEVVRAIRAAGARVDHSCGIHVHVDGAKFKEQPKAIKSLVRLVYNRESFIEKALKIAAHRRGTYCRSIEDRVAEGIRRCNALTTIQRLWYNGSASHRGYTSPSHDHYHHTRYRGVNLHSLFFRGTIEFRWFNGSLHAGEVKAYVQLVLAIAATALTGHVAGKRREFDQEVNQKRTFNWMLKNMGLDGDEYKVTRQHLTKHLPEDQSGRTRASFNGGASASRPTFPFTTVTEERVPPHPAVFTPAEQADIEAHRHAHQLRLSGQDRFRYALVHGCECSTCTEVRRNSGRLAAEESRG